MCLNNWGGIDHKVLEFHEYVNLFSGKSGSGKSTVMDAIQVILYGSFSPSFLNKAADDEVEKELTTIVDLGGTVEDVFVYHKVYGVLRAEMNIKSRMDIRNYIEEIRSGKSSLLKNVTSGYHYHTVRAERVEILDMIQEELQKKGLLAKLQDYEPVDFWGQNNYNE